MACPTSLARLALALGVLTALPARAVTLTVGPGKMYATPCAAIAAAADGDTIEIDAAGSYGGDVCAVPKNRLTLRGVGGRPRIDAAGRNYGGKGIWVISGNDTTVENIEFSGATVPDKNGAGIRQEGQNLTVRGCYFHDNEDGILSGGGPSTEIIIEYSEFANNGFGDGFSHNMYIGNEGRFTLRYSYSHAAKVGHLVKSRAAENYILYNRLSGEDGTGSYEIDLPNAGTSYVIGNLIQQGPSTQNPTFVTYGVEGATPQNPGHTLFVVNNTFVNDRTAGGTFISVGSAITTPAFIVNNIFFGGGTVTNQTGAMQMTNFTQGDPRLVDRAAYDYHLAPGSPCINAGSDPGTGAGFVLLPSRHYVHPAGGADRTIAGIIDIGAYEFGIAADAGADAPSLPDGSGGAGGSSPSDAARTDGPPRDAGAGGTDGGGPPMPDATLADAAADRSRSDATPNDVSRPDALDVSLVDAARDVSVADGAAPDVSVTDATASDAAPPTPTTGTTDGSGCGCRTAPGGGASRAMTAVLALLLAIRKRRARGQGSTPSGRQATCFAND
jgi:MYXO-CTERM domain-containing protein